MQAYAGKIAKNAIFSFGDEKASPNFPLMALHYISEKQNEVN
jgi:hypothetical protein